MRSRNWIALGFVMLAGCDRSYGYFDGLQDQFAALDAAAMDVPMTPPDDTVVMVDPPAPRMIAPLSTATVTSHHPTLRWELAAGTDGAHVQLCRDRAMSRDCIGLEAVGTSVAPDTQLTPGVWFWQLEGRIGTTQGDTTSPVWEFTVGIRSAPVDTSWGTTLDVNGDGLADVLVGSYPAAGRAERAFVYEGGSRGIATTPSVMLDAPDGLNGAFGNAVASAGDVNGDGYADVVVGAPSVNNGDGRAYLYLGSATGLAMSPATTLIGTPGTRSNFGWSVSSGGDVNGDGYADLVVGAPVRSGGAVYVYHGSADGLVTTSPEVLSGIDGSGAEFGIAIAGAGDVDGDGFGDVLVGASEANTITGRAYLFRGGADGLHRNAETFAGPDGPHGEFGYAVAGVGDVNGDGYPDVAFGAPDAIGGAGKLYVHHGSATGLQATAATVLPVAPSSGDYFGYQVIGAGDVNSDGYADIAVGAVGVNSYTGAVYVFHGGTAGVESAASVTLNGPVGVYARFGGSCAAGDTDGDGRPDLQVGSVLAGDSAGIVYLYRNGNGTFSSSNVTMLVAPDGEPSFGFSLACVAPRRRANPARARIHPAASRQGA